MRAQKRGDDPFPLSNQQCSASASANVHCSAELVFMDKQGLMKELQLEPLEFEGGYFHLTYISSQKTGLDQSNQRQRASMSSIFYLLTSDSPINFLHKNRSDIMHYFHLGSPLDIITVDPNGTLQTVTLGPDILTGQKLQYLVPGGCWKMAVLHKVLEEGEGEGGVCKECVENYGLISEAVTPGFDYRDRTMGTDKIIQTEFPQHYERIKPYIFREK